MKIVSERIKNFEKGYQKFVNVLCDEMRISKNLVHRKSDNTLIGYADLDEVDAELKKFDAYVECSVVKCSHKNANWPLPC